MPYTKVGNAIPEQWNYDNLWISAEGTVKSIHKEIRLADFPPEAVNIIGLEICRPVAYPQLVVPNGRWNSSDDGNQIVTGHSITWHRFMEVFEKWFGLS